MHWAESGPYTGEISPRMVKECGAEIVELGHFERRQKFGETDAFINQKVSAALEYGLTPLLCVGETAVERDCAVAEEVVARQVKIALHGVTSVRIPDVVIAYEPGWAIGEGGTNASPASVNAVHGRIRAAIASRHGEEIAARVCVLYGGSVSLANAGAFARQPEVDGLFVGRAGWNVHSFVEIVRTFCAVRSQPVAYET